MTSATSGCWATGSPSPARNRRRPRCTTAGSTCRASSTRTRTWATIRRRWRSTRCASRRRAWRTPATAPPCCACPATGSRSRPACGPGRICPPGHRRSVAGLGRPAAARRPADGAGGPGRRRRGAGPRQRRLVQDLRRLGVRPPEDAGAGAAGALRRGARRRRAGRRALPDRRGHPQRRPRRRRLDRARLVPHPGSPGGARRAGRRGDPDVERVRGARRPGADETGGAAQGLVPRRGREPAHRDRRRVGGRRHRPGGHRLPRPRRRRRPRSGAW